MTPSIVLVSAAYNEVRMDRDINYYYRPLSDFIKQYKSTGGTAKIIVHANQSAWKKMQDLYRIIDQPIIDEPEDHIQAVWDENNWKKVYQNLIKKNPTHCNSYQARFERLIAVYLSKMRLIELAFAQGFDIVLWHDAGHWISLACEHNLSIYDIEKGPALAHGKSCDANLIKLVNQHKIVGSLCREGKTRFHMPMEWVRAYAKEISPNFQEDLLSLLYSAVLWLFHKNHFETFYSNFKAAWGNLIENGHAGIEENALTIASWKLGCPGLSYRDWQKVLFGETKLPDLKYPPNCKYMEKTQEKT